jgi:hypothetical protein
MIDPPPASSLVASHPRPGHPGGLGHDRSGDATEPVEAADGAGRPTASWPGPTNHARGPPTRRRRPPCTMTIGTPSRSAWMRCSRTAAWTRPESTADAGGRGPAGVAAASLIVRISPAPRPGRDRSSHAFCRGGCRRTTGDSAGRPPTRPRRRPARRARTAPASQDPVQRSPVTPTMAISPLSEVDPAVGVPSQSARRPWPGRPTSPGGVRIQAALAGLTDAARLVRTPQLHRDPPLAGRPLKASASVTRGGKHDRHDEEPTRVGDGALASVVGR